MKHQISKVTLMATLAFIGIGFTGAQKASASTPKGPPTDPTVCGEGKNAKPYPKGDLDCKVDTVNTEFSFPCRNIEGYGDILYVTATNDATCTDKKTGQPIEPSCKVASSTPWVDGQGNPYSCPK